MNKKKDDSPVRASDLPAAKRKRKRCPLKRAVRKVRKFVKKNKTFCKAVGVVVAILLLLAATVLLVVDHYLSMIHYEPADDPEIVISDAEDPYWYDEPDIVDSEGTEPGSDGEETGSDGEETGSEGAESSSASEEKSDAAEEKPKKSAMQIKVEEFDRYLKENKAKKVDTSKFRSKDVINILLVGTDGAKSSDVGRSDSMIILSLNTKQKKIVLTSIMRDTYVSINGIANNRINASYSRGGMSLLFRTIEENFKIPLDKYARVNFTAFKDIIEILGGVDIDLTESEVNYFKNTFNVTFEPGPNRLNGVYALEYARARHLGRADFDRTERQRKLIMSIVNEAKQMSLSEINDLAELILPQISTNLSKTEILSLLMNAAEYLEYNIVQCRMPIDNSYEDIVVRGMMVLGVDFDKNREYWYKNVYQ